jgi:ribonuclease E
MVEKKARAKKASPNEKTGDEKKEMKASTGAWWKSAVTQETNGKSDESAALGGSSVVEEEGSGLPQEPVPVRRQKTGKNGSSQGGTDAGESETEIPVQASEIRPKKRPPRKRSSKKTKKEIQDKSEANSVVAEKETGDQAVQEVPPVVGRLEGGPSEQPTSEIGTVVEGDGETEDVQAGSPDLTDGHLPSPAVAAEGSEKKKSGRSRRGRRGNKKSEESKVQPEAGEEAVHLQDETEGDVQEQEEQGNAPKPVLKLLINAEEPEECRLALLEDGRLESIYVSTVTRTHTKNNIYKARIVALEANLQAAFVDYGTEKNGFLPFGEIHPEYYRQNVNEKSRKLIEQHQWKKLSITDVLEKGQEVLVQVVKEEIGTKGANMTTYLSLPGRCVVLLPGSDSSGISRKISGEERRSQLREIMESMVIPEGIGWIVRTASNDINKTALSRDVSYLLRLWTEVKKKGQDMEGVGLVYQDHDSVLRFLREHFDPSIEEILVDDLAALEQVEGFVELLPPKQRTVKVKLHRGARPIFNQYSVEDQIESIYQPRVNLPSGGSIVIDQTEALVAIDVNSGSTSKGQNFEASIFQANMEAATELARQLRLRDLGGLIVVDFIDMRSQKNIREVEKQVKTAMKRDKAKVDISRISKFGLMQISRQKLGAPIDSGNYRVCEHCNGRGTVRSVETLALFYLRRIQTGASRKQVQQVECRFPLDVSQYLLNNKRHELLDLERRYNTEIFIITDPSLKPADNEIVFHKAEKESPAKKQA